MFDLRPTREELLEGIDFPEDKRTFFLGYGSLMYLSGINYKRGMEHVYEWDELFPVMLCEFKRSFCSMFGELAFYGIYPSLGEHTNAVIFEIHTKYDLARLMLAEAAHPIIEKKTGRPLMYETVDVVNNVCGHPPGDYNYPKDFPRNMRVLALITKEIDEKSGVLPWYYITGVWNGIKHWPESFREEFLKTGGLSDQGISPDTGVENPWSGGPLACVSRDKAFSK